MALIAPVGAARAGGLTNVARGKAARQSSTAFRGVASRAVDGNTDGNYNRGSTSCTARQASPWWEVNLGKPHRISEIVLWNRTDCCAGRLRDFVVYVSHRPMGPGGLNAARLGAAWKADHRGQAGRRTAFKVNATGQYVQIGRRGGGYLTLAEVQVFGVPDLTPAKTKPAGIQWEIVPGGDSTCGYFEASTGVKSASVCQKLCERRGMCISFTWDPRSSSCKLKHNPGRRLEPLSVTGRTTWQRFPQSHVRLGGYRLVTNTDSVDECQAFCERENRCVAFVRNTGNRDCHLQDTAGLPLVAGGPAAVSGKRIWKLWPGYDLPGGDFRTQAGTPSAGACQAACQRDKHTCLAFTWNSENKNCYLKDRPGPKPVRVGKPIVTGWKVGWHHGGIGDSLPSRRDHVDPRVRREGTLWMGQYMRSANGRFKLVMRHDGNLVLYDLSTLRPIWSAHTHATRGAMPKAMVQTNGTFVISGVAKPWGPVGVPGPFMVMAGLKLHGDGNLVLIDPRLRDKGYKGWESKTHQPALRDWTFLDVGVGRRRLSLAQVSVGGPIGQPPQIWGVDNSGVIWRRTSDCGFVRDRGAPTLLNSLVAPGRPPALAMRGRLIRDRIPLRRGSLSVGVDGTVWAVNGLGRIFRRGKDGWKKVPGNLKQISVGAKDKVWGVNASGKVLRWSGTGWTEVAADPMLNISVGADGTVYGLARSGAAHRYTGSGWEKLENRYLGVRLRQVAVGRRNAVWGLDRQGKVWQFLVKRWEDCKRSPKCDAPHWQPPWVRRGPPMRWISVGGDGRLLGVTGDGALWRHK